MREIKKRPYRNLGSKRIGQSEKMFNGLNAEIIEYRGTKDMDIMFENGVIVKGVQYDNFLKKKIKCPMIVEEIDGYLIVINANTHPETVFIVDVDMREIVSNNYFGRSAAARGGGYVVSNKMGLIHRLIMNASPDEYVDHINGDTTDNRRENLRICSNANNIQNSGVRKNNTSGYKGVWWNERNQCWQAQIRSKGKRIHVGNFKCKHEAAKAWNAAALKYHDEFAKLNEI